MSKRTQKSVILESICRGFNELSSTYNQAVRIQRAYERQYHRGELSAFGLQVCRQQSVRRYQAMQRCADDLEARYHKLLTTP